MSYQLHRVTLVLGGGGGRDGAGEIGGGGGVTHTDGTEMPENTQPYHVFY